MVRQLQRLLILALGALTVWLIVFVFFEFDNRVPWVLALALTYGIAAYGILPRVVRLGLKILLRKSVPRFTTTGDGLPGDPVNLALIGTLGELRAAFTATGWTEADPLSLASSWGMIRAFVFNRPYPAAPFSTLYLFGRGQDIGFQKAIDDSPRKRHHIRFWALSLERAEEPMQNASFWLNTDRPPADATVLWVGAGTKDTGLSLHRVHLPDHPRHRRRHQRGARLHRRRTARSSRHRRRHQPAGRQAIVRARQPLHRRRRRYGGEAARLGMTGPCSGTGSRLARCPKQSRQAENGMI